MIHLKSADLGSLTSGSLVYFRKIPVGRVYDYAINPNNQGVTIDVLIERRFTNLVKKEPFLERIRREGGCQPERRESPAGQPLGAGERRYRL
jgi:hypothetical protein